MNLKKLTLSVVLLLSFVFVVNAALRQSAAVAGKWQGVAKGHPSGDLNFVLGLRAESNKLEGEVSVPGAVFPGGKGDLKDNMLTLSFPRGEDATIKLVGTIKDNKITGKWDVTQNGKVVYSGAFECQKKE